MGSRGLGLAGAGDRWGSWVGELDVVVLRSVGGAIDHGHAITCEPGCHATLSTVDLCFLIIFETHHFS